MQFDLSLVIDKGCIMINEAGHHFACTDVTMSKAMLIYHLYRKERDAMSFLSRDLSDRTPNTDELMFPLYATAAFCLIYPVCGEELNMQQVVAFFEKLGTPPSPDEVTCIETLTEQIGQVMLDIHKAVFGAPYRPREPAKFNFANQVIDVSHRFVCAYEDQFASVPQIKAKLVAWKTTTLKLLNTFYHCKKSTSYTALEMAWAAMHISFRMSLIDIEDIRIVRMELAASVNEERHKNVMDEILIVAGIATQDVDR